MRRRNKPVKVAQATADRFWAKVQNARIRGCCWPWVGYKKKSGHGLTTLAEHTGRRIPLHAHKVAWLLVRGEIPEGLCANHKCHNPACCNPEHMYLGTRAENMQDRFDKKARKYRVQKAKRATPPEPTVSAGACDTMG